MTEERQDPDPPPSGQPTGVPSDDEIDTEVDQFEEVLRDGLRKLRDRPVRRRRQADNQI
jgi:hypothetical protein